MRLPPLAVLTMAAGFAVALAAGGAFAQREPPAGAEPLPWLAVDAEASPPPAAAGQRSSIELRWDAVAEAKGYLVERRALDPQAPGMAEPRYDVLAPLVPATSYEDPSARTGVAYAYRVTALGPDGEPLARGASQAEIAGVPEEATAARGYSIPLAILLLLAGLGLVVAVSAALSRRE